MTVSAQDSGTLAGLFAPVRNMLSRLLHSDAFERGDIEKALGQITEAASMALRVERSSVWRFDNEQSELTSLDLYEKSENRHSRGTVLRAVDTPDYFTALAEERSIAAHDARTDPRTREFAKDYLVTHGITSMLDAPVVLNGKLVGVVCNEHVGDAPRKWAPWEELVTATLADFVAMALGASERAQQAKSLENYRKQLEHLVAERTNQLKQSQERVREVNERFHVMFEAAPVALILTRISDNEIMAANRVAAKMFGVAPDQVVGQHAPDFWVDIEARNELLAKLKAERDVDSFEAKVREAGGRVFWSDIAARYLLMDGEPGILFGLRDVTLQKEAEERLRMLASTDELTGALNRRSIFEVANEELERARRYDRPLSVAMLDLDHFKSVNDRFGHSVGDEALRNVTDTIRSAVRKQDKIGRYGGEELLVVLPETEVESARTVVDRTRERVEAIDLRGGDVRVPLTISAGVVALKAGEDLGTILRRADSALYEAKSSGRNRVVAGA